MQYYSNFDTNAIGAMIVAYSCDSSRRLVVTVWFLLALEKSETKKDRERGNKKGDLYVVAGSSRCSICSHATGAGLEIVYK